MTVSGDGDGENFPTRKWLWLSNNQWLVSPLPYEVHSNAVLRQAQEKKRTLTMKKELEKLCGDRTCTVGVGPEDFGSGAGLGSPIISESEKSSSDHPRQDNGSHLNFALTRR
jgi:hypothetical protein